jgi:hypothetical protein
VKAIAALYTSSHSADNAFRELRRVGVAEDDITVMSSEPLDDCEFFQKDRNTMMSWIAVLGAALGLGIAYLLTSLTQSSWPINTGGMPTVTHWTNLIIMFELTMLGAALATVVTLVISARLPRRLPEFYDPAISQGKILVAVGNPSADRTGRIEEALRAANPERVTRF